MFAEFKKCRTFASLLKRKCEHLPYKQRVGGSNPSTPTIKQSLTKKFVRLFLFLTAFIQTFSILLLYNSGKRVNFAV